MVSCPTRSVNTALMETGSFLRLFRWLEEKSIFPVGGGLMEQSCFFLHCCEFMHSYSNLYRKRMDEAKEKMDGIKKRAGGRKKR